MKKKHETELKIIEHSNPPMFRIVAVLFTVQYLMEFMNLRIYSRQIHNLKTCDNY